MCYVTVADWWGRRISLHWLSCRRISENRKEEEECKIIIKAVRYLNEWVGCSVSVG